MNWPNAAKVFLKHYGIFCENDFAQVIDRPFWRHLRPEYFYLAS